MHAGLKSGFLLHLQFGWNLSIGSHAAGAICLVIELMIRLSRLIPLFEQPSSGGWREAKHEPGSVPFTMGCVHDGFLMLLFRCAVCADIHPVLLDMALVFVPPRQNDDPSQVATPQPHVLLLGTHWVHAVAHDSIDA